MSSVYQNKLGPCISSDLHRRHTNIKLLWATLKEVHIYTQRKDLPLGVSCALSCFPANHTHNTLMVSVEWWQFAVVWYLLTLSREGRALKYNEEENIHSIYVIVWPASKQGTGKHNTQEAISDFTFHCRFQVISWPGYLKWLHKENYLKMSYIMKNLCQSHSRTNIFQDVNIEIQSKTVPHLLPVLNKANHSPKVTERIWPQTSALVISPSWEHSCFIASAFTFTVRLLEMFFFFYWPFFPLGAWWKPNLPSLFFCL